jgi:hypothetical protein
MPINRCRRDQKFFAERRLDAVRIEVAFRAIALNAARRPGESGRLIAGESVFDRKGIVAVVGGRGNAATGRCLSLPHVAGCRRSFT